LALGMRYRGPRGAAACILGLLGPPFFIILGIGVLYSSYGTVPEVKAVLRGLAAAAAGLFVALSFQGMGSVPRDWGLMFFLLAFVAIGLLRLPLAMVLLVLAPISIAVAWFQK